MSEDGEGSRLVVALEATKPTGRTRLIRRDAVKNPLCNTPKASSVSAGGFERVRYEVEKQIRTWRSWFEGESEDLNFRVARCSAALRVADDTPSREIRRQETD